MLGRIKYWLLTLLLDDICTKSECVGAYEDCAMNNPYDVVDEACTCCGNFVFVQARKAWVIEKRNPRNKRSI